MTIKRPYLSGVTREAWLKERKKFITATEAGDLMGFNQYSSPAQLLKSKASDEIKSIDNEYMARGRENEDAVRKQCLLDTEEELFLTPEHQQFLKDKPEGEFLEMWADEENRISSTPDGLTKSGKCIEVKCTGVYKAGSWEYPLTKYLLQTQVQMHTTGAKECYIIARFFFGWPKKGCKKACDRIWHVTYSPEVMKILFDRMKKFWYALDNGKSMRKCTKTADKCEELLQENCKIFKGFIKEEEMADLYEIPEYQLRIIRGTCIKAACKMTDNTEEALLIAEDIENNIFWDIGRANNDNSRDFMIALGVAVNSFVEAGYKGGVEELEEHVKKVIPYLTQEELK